MRILICLISGGSHSNLRKRCSKESQERRTSTFGFLLVHQTSWCNQAEGGSVCARFVCCVHSLVYMCRLRYGCTSSFKRTSIYCGRSSLLLNRLLPNHTHTYTSHPSQATPRITTAHFYAHRLNLVVPMWRSLSLLTKWSRKCPTKAK